MSLENKIENKPIIILDSSERTTSNIMNKYEVAAILSRRSNEIANGSPYDQSLVDEIQGDITAQKIAEKELEYGLIPYEILRKIGPNKFEKFYANEMYYRED